MVATRSKRTLEEADPNATASKPDPKALKKANDGKENEAANDWYASLPTSELQDLCRSRGMSVGLSSFAQVEYVPSLDRYSLDG